MVGLAVAGKAIMVHLHLDQEHQDKDLVVVPWGLLVHLVVVAQVVMDLVIL
jgi:hypothetical protein